MSFVNVTAAADVAAPAAPGDIDDDEQCAGPAR